jgi:glycerol-3-phosphate O-acyltransferase
MGRNLLCVHSKKHIMDDPSTRSEKMRDNVRTLKVSGPDWL